MKKRIEVLAPVMMEVTAVIRCEIDTDAPGYDPEAPAASIPVHLDCEILTAPSMTLRDIHERMRSDELAALDEAVRKALEAE